MQTHYGLRYQDPFEDYKTRLAKKLAKRAESGSGAAKPPEKKLGDDTNWFGVKVGMGNSIASEANVGKGVGRYLGLKRQLEEQETESRNGAIDRVKKQKHVGFGNFDNW